MGRFQFLRWWKKMMQWSWRKKRREAEFVSETGTKIDFDAGRRLLMQGSIRKSWLVTTRSSSWIMFWNSIANKTHLCCTEQAGHQSLCFTRNIHRRVYILSWKQSLARGADDSMHCLSRSTTLHWSLLIAPKVSWTRPQIGRSFVSGCRWSLEPVKGMVC